MSWLTEELVRRGHEVTLFASGDSQTSARLISPAPRALRLDPARPDPLAFHMIELRQVFERAREFDVIHAHVDYLAFPFARLVSTPTVHTLHGRLDLPHVIAVGTAFPDVPLVSISDDQRRPLAALGLNWIATVPHGLPVGQIPFRPEPAPDRYLAFVGRISIEKRVDLAIEVARRVGLPLRIAAKVDPADVEYFDTVIRPLLDGPGVEFLGELGDAEKYALMAGAIALLFPIDWPEPFGLVMTEAMACGTPIVARPCGAVPEVLRDGAAGFVADSVEELVAAVKRIDLIDRRRCRAEAEQRFSVSVMAEAYEAVYRQMLGDHRRT